MHGCDITELTLNEIAKIEGKASLTVRKSGDDVDVRFSITELKRFYTQALIGKDVMAVPQLTARICGTCSNAHLLCAIKAIEKAYDVPVSIQTKKLRELLNWGLIIRDHTLHLYVFVLPDLLGYDSILDLDEHKDEEHQLLHDTFDIKAVGNNLAKAVAGRSVHAPFLGIGGFLKLPQKIELSNNLAMLEGIRPAVLRMIRFFATRDNTLTRDVRFSALVDEHLTFLNGMIVDSLGRKTDEQGYGSRLVHSPITHSHASSYTDEGTVYMVGALARLNVAKDNLHSQTKKDASDVLGLFPSNNIFHNNLAQAIEVLHAIDSSIEIIRTLEEIVPETPKAIQRNVACRAVAVIEAPRGTLLYELGFDEKGKTNKVKIIVPTGQNQIGIQDAIREYIMSNPSVEKKEAELMCERIIRAYDPCMSCASHFLKVRWYG